MLFRYQVPKHYHVTKNVRLSTGISNLAIFIGKTAADPLHLKALAFLADCRGPEDSERAAAVTFLERLTLQSGNVNFAPFCSYCGSLPFASCFLTYFPFGSTSNPHSFPSVFTTTS